MPSYIRMKTIYLRGLLWLYLLGFGYMALSLEPGFLDFDNLPDTNFSCVGKVIGGYYADLETNCQMFHVCTIGQLDEPMDIRFLCLNGTVFDQETRVCERIDEVDCSKSEQFYSLNLELYGNTQPSLVEDNPETDPPIIIKSTTTTTTTTTTQRPKPKTTRAQFYTTATPTVTTATKVISTHHFPISSQPDIRFNPEEINISLNPGSPPNIRTKPVSFQQQIFSNSDDVNHNNNKKAIVTTHTTYGNDGKEDFVRVVPHTQRPQVSSTTQKTKSVVNYGLTHDKAQPPATPADINYGFTYHQTENTNQEYRTEIPHHNYQYHTNNYNKHGQYRNQFKTTTYRTEHITTRKHPYNPHKEPTTYRNPYVISSIKPTSYHTAYRTEKPQRLQLPLPLLPTLPPLTFSSPAPFTLTRHIETKRYTNDHQPPPRIIISASASVSDASGRRLNYSLGTIGVAPLLEEPPTSYDDYKDHDVVLDPFYHDVPKIKKGKRRKRQIKHSDIIRNEQEAVDVLKFLFDWYKDQETTTGVTVPIPPEVITQINEQLAPIAEAPEAAESQNITDEVERSQPEKDVDSNFRESALFKRRSKFNIVGDVLSVTEKLEETTTSTTTPVPETIDKYGTEDYVDDNYEALVQDDNVTKAEETKVEEVGTSIKEETSENKEENTYISEEKKEIHETENVEEDEVQASSKEETHEDDGSETEEEKEIHEEEKTDDDEVHSLNEEIIENREDKAYLSESSTEEKGEIYEQEKTEDAEVHTLNEETSEVKKEDLSESHTEESEDINKKDENEEDKVDASVNEEISEDREDTNIPESQNEEEEKIIEKDDFKDEEHVSIKEEINEEAEQTEDKKEVSEYNTEAPEKNEESETDTPNKEEIIENKNEEGYVSSSQTDEKHEINELNIDTEHKTEEDEVDTTDSILETSSETHETESRIEEPTEDYKENVEVTTQSIKSETKSEEVILESLETTIPTIITTPKPKTRRRGRGRFHHQRISSRISNEEDGIEASRKYSSSFINDPSQIPRPKSRRRGRVRSTTEFYKTEITSEETVQTTTIPLEEKEEENLETTENIVTTLSNDPETTTMNSLKDEEHETETTTVTEIPPEKPTTVKETQIPEYYDNSETTRKRQKGRGRGRGRSRSRLNNNYKHETESKKSIESTYVTEESRVGTSELPKKDETDEATVNKYKDEKNEETVLSAPQTIDNENKTETTSTLSIISSTTSESASGALESSKYEEEEQTTLSLQRHKSNRNKYLSEDVAPTSKTVSDEQTAIEASRRKNLNEDVVPTSYTINGEETIGPPLKDRSSTSTDGNKFATDFPSSSLSTTENTVQHRYSTTISNIIPTSETRVDKITLSSTETSTAHTFKESTLSLSYLASLAFTNAGLHPTVTTESNLVKAKEINNTSTEPTNLTPAELTTTETVISSPRSRGHSRRTRPRHRNPSSHNKPNSRHRFSTELVTPRPSRRKPVEEEIVDVLASRLTTTESVDKGEEIYSTSTKIPTTTTTDYVEDVPATDAPLFKSANPTQAESAKASLHTTPLSMVYHNKVHVRREKIRRSYIFNCFGKAINKFYSDPRDCRLFHYCTSGYTKNQLLDMKFVCDSGTYFDDEKLICTKVKPERCL